MREFKFGEGYVDNRDELIGQPYEDIFGITGYLNGLFYNRLAEFVPYKKEVNGYVYESTINEFSYNEWREIFESNNEYRFYFYAILKPTETDLFPEEVIELHGSSEIFPYFVIINPDTRYFYEYIKVPINP